jgi:hypothetical protein
MVAQWFKSKQPGGEHKDPCGKWPVRRYILWETARSKGTELVKIGKVVPIKSKERN